MVNEKILIVEDELYTAEGIKIILKRASYSPVSEIARTYDQALEYVEKYRPDLILMDIMIDGDKTGIDASRDIQDSYDIPIIFLTAFFEDDILKEAINTQPYGYIIKPVTHATELMPTIELALSKHKLKSQNRKIETKVDGDTYTTKLEKLNQIFHKENLEAIKSFFSVLANQIRIHILLALRYNIHGFNEIMKHIDKAAGTLSHHLAKLEKVNLTYVKREGKSTLYFFNEYKYPQLTILLNQLRNKQIAIDDLKNTFLAYSSSDRLEIILLLQHQPGTSDEFAVVVPKTPGTISRHVNILKKANLIRIAQNVKPIIYQINLTEHLKYMKIYREFITK